MWRLRAALYIPVIANTVALVYALFNPVIFGKPSWVFQLVIGLVTVVFVKVTTKRALKGIFQDSLLELWSLHCRD